MSVFVMSVTKGLGRGILPFLVSLVISAGMGGQDAS